MFFSYIVQQLQRSYEVSYEIEGDKFSIIDIVFLTFCPVSWSEHTLYIGKSSILSPLPDRPIMLITTDDAPVNDILLSGSSLCIIKDKDLNDIYRIIKNIFYKDLKSQVILYKVSEEALNGKDIVSLINTAASLIGNALILVDANMKVLVHSTDFEIMDPLWAENIKLGYYSSEFIQKVKSNKDMQEWRKSDAESKVITLDGDKQPKVVTRITQNGHVVGGLIMIAHHTPINHSNVKQLSKIGKILFDTFNNIFGDNRFQSFHSTILYHLLSGDDISSTIDLSILPHQEFPKNMTVVVARFIRRIENRYFKKTVGVELERIFPNGYPVHFKNYIGIMVQSISHEQLKELNNLVESEEINIGISWQFTDILDFRKYFYQAVSSIKQAQRLGVTNMILDYTDYSFYDLLFNYSGKVPLQNFCHPALQLLKDYDKVNNTQLYITLKTYLKCNRNLGITAEALFLHRNSVIYRINRIVDVTGIDLNNINTIYSLVDSYRIQTFLEDEQVEIRISANNVD